MQNGQQNILSDEQLSMIHLAIYKRFAMDGLSLFLMINQ